MTQPHQINRKRSADKWMTAELTKENIAIN